VPPNFITSRATGRQATSEVRAGRACYKPIFDLKMALGFLLAAATLLLSVARRRRA